MRASRDAVKIHLHLLRILLRDRPTAPDKLRDWACCGELIFCEGVAARPRRRSVVYRLYAFFVAVLPSANKLALVLNLDFSDIDDPSGPAEAAKAV